MRFLLLSILLFAASSGLYADMREADQAYAEKDYPAAIAAYQAVLAQDPDDLVAMRQLGASYYNSGDKARSLGVYEAALIKKPEDAATQRFVDALKGQGVTALPYAAPELIAPVAEPHPKYGIRFGMGYGLPTSIIQRGSDVSTGGAYAFGMGGGLTTNGEFLWAFHPQLELGVGLQFIGNVGSFSSKDYSGVQEETYKVDSSVSPLDLTLYALIPQTPALSWVFGLGPAIALAGDYRSTEESKVSGSTIKDVAVVDLETGIGYHGLVGAEYKFSPRFSILAGLDLEAINLARSKETGTHTSTSPSGTLVSNLSYEIVYVDAPPKLKAPTTTVSGTVSTTDDGVEVTTYDSATGKSTSKKTVGKTETVDFNRIAPFLRATFRF